MEGSWSEWNDGPMRMSGCPPSEAKYTMCYIMFMGLHHDCTPFRTENSQLVTNHRSCLNSNPLTHSKMISNLLFGYSQSGCLVSITKLDQQRGGEAARWVFSRVPNRRRVCMHMCGFVDHRVSALIFSHWFSLVSMLVWEPETSVQARRRSSLRLSSWAPCTGFQSCPVVCFLVPWEMIDVEHEPKSSSKKKQ